MKANEEQRYVAIKQLNWDCRHYLREFFYEAEILKQLKHHPNVVELEGILFDRDRMQIVLEYLSGGNLQKFLRKNISRVLDNYYHSDISPKQITNYARDVAEALQYMQSKHIVHCDIAARNVLLTSDKRAKLSDFGLSFDISKGNRNLPRGVSYLPPIPIRSTAPEVLNSKPASHKSDIWSYGTLLFEIATFGGVPHAQILSDNALLEYLKSDCSTLQLPTNMPIDLQNLISNCTKHEPNERYTIREILTTLESHPDIIKPCIDISDTVCHSNGTSSNYTSGSSIISKTTLAGYTEIKPVNYHQEPEPGVYAPINSVIPQCNVSGSSTSRLLPSLDYVEMYPTRSKNLRRHKNHIHIDEDDFE